MVVPPSAGSASGGNGAVSPTEGGSAYGGKTVVLNVKLTQLAETNGAGLGRKVIHICAEK